MSTTTGQGIEALAVRRATFADADKVRYRVYRTATDYIAVIAENALMAVKVSGIAEPYRIIRDLPTEGVTLRAGTLTAVVDQPVSLATEAKDKAPMFVDLGGDSAPTSPVAPAFVPMQLRDLPVRQSKKLTILSADALAELMGISAPPPLPVAPPALTSTPTPIKPTPLEEGPDRTLSPEEVQQLLGE